MKFIVGVAIAVVALLVVVLADVSHLSGQAYQYLPPHSHHEPGHHHPNQHHHHISHESGHHQHMHHVSGHHVHQENGEDAQLESHGLERTIEENEVNEEEDTAETEPEPAHRLEADGYHYKTPEHNNFFF